MEYPKTKNWEKKRRTGLLGTITTYCKYFSGIDILVVCEIAFVIKVSYIGSQSIECSAITLQCFLESWNICIHDNVYLSFRTPFKMHLAPWATRRDKDDLGVRDGI